LHVWRSVEDLVPGGRSSSEVGASAEISPIVQLGRRIEVCEASEQVKTLFSSLLLTTIGERFLLMVCASRIRYYHLRKR